MFDALSDKFSSVFEGLRKRGALSEADVTEALREVRLAMLEADVPMTMSACEFAFSARTLAVMTPVESRTNLSSTSG